MNKSQLDSSTSHMLKVALLFYQLHFLRLLFSLGMPIISSVHPLVAFSVGTFLAAKTCDIVLIHSLTCY